MATTGCGTGFSYFPPTRRGRGTRVHRHADFGAEPLERQIIQEEIIVVERGRRDENGVPGSRPRKGAQDVAAGQQSGHRDARPKGTRFPRRSRKPPPLAGAREFGRQRGFENRLKQASGDDGDPALPVRRATGRPAAAAPVG